MMLQCENCEFFHRDEKGRIQLRCDPFRTIKEPECLAKWQLLRQDALLQAYHATLQWQQRLAPMQEKMFEFMDRLVNVCLPRIRDFNGVSRKSFDNQGNYSLGITDQAIFPEIDTGKLQYTQGMDITFVFNKSKKEETMHLLDLLGLPFTKK